MREHPNEVYYGKKESKRRKRDSSQKLSKNSSERKYEESKELSEAGEGYDRRMNSFLTKTNNFYKE